MSVDALGNPLRFTLTGGQRHDITQAQALIADYQSEYVIADKGYDSDEFLQIVLAGGAVPVIPPRSRRKALRQYDEHLYRERHLVSSLSSSAVATSSRASWPDGPQMRSKSSPINSAR